MRRTALGLLSAASIVTLALSVLAGHVETASAEAQQQPPSLPDLLGRAASYLEAYERTLPTIIAEEEYRQTSRGSGGPRMLHSDIMLVGLGNSQWVEFRDVFDVSGKPVHDHDARLQALLAGSSSQLLEKAQQIADESARYNIGVTRNINVPTMALTYLSRVNQPRSTFRITGTESVHGTRATVVHFTETASPPLIHVPVGTVETSGRFWLATETGAVLKTELSVKIPPSSVVPKEKRLDGQITVEYRDDDHIKVLVPVQMDEFYQAPAIATGKATYSHFQASEVSVMTQRGRGGDWLHR